MINKLLVLFLFTRAGLMIRNVELFGNNTLGYYYIEAYVGTPPQKKALILDTGSHLTIFPCSGCYACRNHLYKIFDSRKSSTFELVNPQKNYFDCKCNIVDRADKCKFTQAYTEGSEYQGFYAIDNFVFENELNQSGTDLKHVFGCAMKETNLFYSQEVDGIIGFGVSGQSKSKVNSNWPSPNYPGHRAEGRKDHKSDFLHLCGAKRRRTQFRRLEQSSPCTKE